MLFPVIQTTVYAISFKFGTSLSWAFVDLSIEFDVDRLDGYEEKGKKTYTVMNCDTQSVLFPITQTTVQAIFLKLGTALSWTSSYLPTKFKVETIDGYGE